MISFSQTKLSREQFLEWMGANTADEQLAFLRSKAKRKTQDSYVTLVWPDADERSIFTPVISVPASEMREFFAFTSTYIATYRPFSAFYHVIPAEQLQDLIDVRPLPKDLAFTAAKIATGAALAEHYVNTRSSPVDKARPLAKALKSTLSVMLGQSTINGYTVKNLPWLIGQWRAANSHFPLSAYDPQSTRSIGRIWSHIFALFSDIRLSTSDELSVPIQKFLRTSLEQQRVSDDALLELQRTQFDGPDLSSALRSSREERVRMLNDFAAKMGSGYSVSIEQEFTAGLLLAILGNGSFDMLRSAKELASRSPASIIWFGVCASLFEETNVLSTGNSVGRIVTRDLLSTDWLYPRADISLDEFETLAASKDAALQVNFQNSEEIFIEILPGVSTYVQRPTDSSTMVMTEEVQILLDGLQEIAAVVDRTQRRLSDVAGPVQDELFRGNRRPRSKIR